jgi:hypothetical protein
VNCGDTAAFDTARSSSFAPIEDEFGQPLRDMITYVSGPVAGYVVRDDIRIAGDDFRDFPFLLVEKVGVALGQWDGILGIGPPSLASVAEGFPAFLQRRGLILGLIPEPDSGGRLILTPELPGLVWVPSAAQAWYVDVRVAVDRTNADAVPVSVLVDTGTSLLIVPMEAYAPLLTALIDDRERCGVDTTGLVFCECSTPITTLRIFVAGQTFRLTGDDLLLPSGDAGLCAVAVAPGGATWILGDVFFRKFAVFFDFAGMRVGFRQAPEDFDPVEEVDARVDLRAAWYGAGALGAGAAALGALLYVEHRRPRSMALLE